MQRLVALWLAQPEPPRALFSRANIDAVKRGDFDACVLPARLPEMIPPLSRRQPQAPRDPRWKGVKALPSPLSLRFSSPRLGLR
jgi:hypothetical protein